jgi:hypothetical protein
MRCLGESNGRFALNQRQSKCAQLGCWGFGNKTCVCKYVKYCCQVCAKADWDRHKRTCRVLRCLSGDGFVTTQKFSKRYITPFSFYTYMKGLNDILMRMFMVHNLMRICVVPSAEIEAMIVQQLHSLLTRVCVQQLDRMQPSESVASRAQTARMMVMNTYETHADWLIPTKGVFIERVLQFLVPTIERPKCRWE